jgi:hypothetical protein
MNKIKWRDIQIKETESTEIAKIVNEKNRNLFDLDKTANSDTKSEKRRFKLFIE